MGEKTKIEWCDSTCNLMMGCDGCELFPDHCYAARLVNRHAGQAGWPKKFTKPQLFLERMDEALRWKDLAGVDRPHKPWLNGMPRLIFLNDLGDCFTESIEDLRWLGDAVQQMFFSKHIFMLLTKRPKRLAEFIDWWQLQYCSRFPRNVWGGTTITGPETLYRAAELANTDLSVRFISLEPLLNAVDLADTDALTYCNHSGRTVYGECEHGLGCRERSVIEYCEWIIAGGETGPGARYSHPDSFRSIRDLCQAEGVPFFFKGWGDFHVSGGKKMLGRELDNCEWNGMPEVDRG